MGIAVAEAASSDMDSWAAEPRDRHLVRATSLSVCGARDLPRAYRRAVEHLSRRGGERRLPGGAGEFRLSAESICGGDRREGARDREVRHVRRRWHRLLAVRPAT